jgi:hypothetical protein
VTEIMEVQTGHADCVDGSRPGGHLVEVAAPQWAALGAGEDERAWLVAAEHRQVVP